MIKHPGPLAPATHQNRKDRNTYLIDVCWSFKTQTGYRKTSILTRTVCFGQMTLKYYVFSVANISGELWVNIRACFSYKVPVKPV